MKSSQCFAAMAVTFALLAIAPGGDFIVHFDRLLAGLSLIGMALAAMSERRNR